MRALKRSRHTRRLGQDGHEREVQDEWSLFLKKEERFEWWKEITEFKVDIHFLKNALPPSSKKRGEGEVFAHEIPASEWP